MQSRKSHSVLNLGLSWRSEVPVDVHVYDRTYRLRHTFSEPFDLCFIGPLAVRHKCINHLRLYGQNHNYVPVRFDKKQGHDNRLLKGAYI